MTQATIAVFLSAFVFPGIGHFYLKRPRTGLALAAVTLLSLTQIIVPIVQRAMQIATRIQRGEVPFDIGIISELVTKQTAAPASRLQQIAILLFFVAWCFGIGDCYRLSRQQDKSTQPQDG